MKKEKIFAGIVGAVMLCSAVPVIKMAVPADYSSVYAEESGEPQTTVVYSADFEDGKNDFTGRDGIGTFTVVSTDAHSGTNCLECSDRTKGWHGPQLLLDDMLEPGVEYIASAWVKAAWYNDVNMSMEYTDSEGTRHFSNLKSAVSQGDWAEISEVKFSVPKNVTNAYIYFECSDGANIYVDDFQITTAPVYEIQQDIPSLKDVYSPYFKIGGAVTTSELAPKSAQDLIKKHYNSLTPGNELKPESILDKAACQELAAQGDDTNPQVDISSAREILDFCRDNNISVRGHVLVWHSQTPDWFFKENYDDDADWVTKEVMLQRMENYIKNVFETLEAEYPTVDFYAWDVVNEAWLDDGNPRQPGEQGSSGSNNSAWVRIFGDNSFIEPAFEYARKYAPEGCKLYYNDFNEYMPAKTTAIVDMANDLKKKGLIDGIGMQSHLDVGFPTASTYEKALKAFSETGLDVQITELDITTSDTSEAGFETQAQLYSDVMDACVKYADSVSAVVFWGTTDDKSWRASRCPLLFNEDFTAKPAYYAIIDGLDIPETEPTTEAPTDTPTEEPTTPEIDFIPGDVKEDGVVNVFDAVALREIIISHIGVDYLPAPYASAGDTTGDGAIEVNDLVLLHEYLVGKDVELTYYKGE